MKQIWVMGSAADLNYQKKVSDLAYKLGQKIAINWYTLIYWAEKDCNSLSTSAAKWAKLKWGIVIWVTYWKTSKVRWEMENIVDGIICTGMERGGWREYILVSSCDAIIVIWWWSWTLNEITIAYQKKIPIFVLNWIWGWADKLSDKYIDDRYKTDPERFICKWVNNIQEALDELDKIS